MKIVVAFGRMKVLNRFPKETCIWEGLVHSRHPLCAQM